MTKRIVRVESDQNGLFIEVKTPESSSITQMSWLLDSLAVEFTSGRKYAYYDVPLSVLQQIITAESVGESFSLLVKKGPYKYAELHT